MFITLFIDENFWACPHVGWKREQIDFELKFYHRLWNCDKTLISSLKDFSTEWTGYNAVYFENCAQMRQADVPLITRKL